MLISVSTIVLDLISYNVYVCSVGCVCEPRLIFIEKSSDDIELSDTELPDSDQYESYSDVESETDFIVEPSESPPSIDLKSPAIEQYYSDSLPTFRHLCDLCMKIPDDGSIGGSVTLTNADKHDRLKVSAELVLKFYNDTKLKNFKLVKLCKFNIASIHYGLTFRAREDGSEECPLFRGVVRCVGGQKPVFCEIKEDDEVTLLPGDDDYVSSESCDIKGSPSCTCDDIGMSDTELPDSDQYESHHSDFESDEDADFIVKPSESPPSDLKSPAVAQYFRNSLPRLRELCDLCMPPDIVRTGGAITLTNADKEDGLKDLAESVLKFYNDTKLKNFKLVKVCKINIVDTCYGITLRAQEDGSEECPLFRGVVHSLGGEKPVFCEIKQKRSWRWLKK
ncbi:uncharacterized protein [Henckelia pumila]|uniref:uncharacterized protein isoform X2 n=1 Tax=Henckelia pumila TaxID=405737 RepID=UPI003C6E3D61